MTVASLLPSTRSRAAWKRTLLGAAAWILAVSVLALAAAIRAAGVPGSPVRAAFEYWLFLMLAAGAAAFVVITAATSGLERLHGRLRRGRPERADLPEALAAFSAALVFLLAVPPLFRALPIPLATSSGWTDIPLVGRPVLMHFKALLGLVALETGLALWWIVEPRGWPWHVARTAVGALWCAFLVTVIAGPNPLRGDPLEWAAHLGSGIPPAWLGRAPRIMQPWWPALQVGLAAALLATLLGLAGDARTAWRLRRTDD